MTMQTYCGNLLSGKGDGVQIDTTKNRAVTVQRHIYIVLQRCEKGS